MTAKTNDVLVSQLIAVRAQVDALIALVTAEVSEECGHPAGDRVDRTEMGGPVQFHCRRCGEDVTIVEEDENEGA